MNTLTVKELVRTINVSDIKENSNEETYAIIYPLMDKCIITSKKDLLNELSILWKYDVQDMRIIRIHRSIPDECAFAIAHISGLAYEYDKCVQNGLTPYQALQEWDLV